MRWTGPAEGHRVAHDVEFEILVAASRVWTRNTGKSGGHPEKGKEGRTHDMTLSFEQKRQIYDRGFVTVPGVVPQVMVDAALRAINHSVGQGMNVDEMTKFRAQSYCSDIKNTPVITDLLNRTPALALAESVLGEGNVSPVKGGQVALRFPSLQDPPGKPGCHLDGMYSPTNGVPEGTIQNFTLLAGVLLSDLPHAFAGNFTVWPGTHHRFEAYFREHGPDSLLKGMPPIEYPEPEQVIGKAGDVVLCHYQVAHGVAPNVSAHVRYAIFFRLYHNNHGSCRKEAMTDIWLEWPGIRESILCPAK